MRKIFKNAQKLKKNIQANIELYSKKKYYLFFYDTFYDRGYCDYCVVMMNRIGKNMLEFE
jgi:hypothetical protein